MNQEISHKSYLEIRIQPVFGPGRVDVYRHTSDGNENLIAGFPGLQDEGEFAELVTAVKEALEVGPTNGIIDFSGFSWLNSSGLGKLLVIWKEFNAKQGQLVLVGLKPRVKEVFRITKLIQVFTIVESLDDALALFEK
jgi:anti-sigma B factor antagonist